ncbi:MAG: hypothetical protein AAAFM81_14475 [Pseudomonadota bacterium]
MHAVTIHDLRTSDQGGSFLAFDLIDVLRAIESLVDGALWEVSKVWCIRRGDEEPVFENRLDWSQLTAFAEDCSQVIDGEFRAFRSDGAEPWLAIVADDSTYYVVLTDDYQAMQAIRDCFNDVRDSDEWAANFSV